LSQLQWIKSKKNKPFSRIAKPFYLCILKILGFNQATYDAIIVEYIRLTPVTLALQQIYPSAKYLVDTHDVLYLRELAFQRYGFSSGVSLTTEQEKGLLSHYDAIIGITISDCQQFSQLQPTSRVICASHAYTPMRADSTPESPIHAEHGRCNLLYIGTGGIPNVDAVTVLFREIIPIVDRLTKRNYSLHIVGDVCNQSFIRQLYEQASSPHIYLYGVLPNSLDIYRHIDIVCNPVRFGGGVKIKNIEAIANHCVLVTTSEGARGLPSSTLPYYICADYPDIQASAISQLINCPDLLNEFKSRTVSAANLLLSSSRVYHDLDRYILDLPRIPLPVNQRLQRLSSSLIFISLILPCLNPMINAY
jgi:hypothetical protein